MFTKLDNRVKQGHGPIRALYPGLLENKGDTGLATLGRIDQAALPAGALVAMHPHVNDEILSYFRSGRVRHTDSEGFTEFITDHRLMLMKAGRSFFHEEKVMEDGGMIEGLQIFIRPSQKDLEPAVTFYDLDQKYSENTWRLMAGYAGSGAPLELRSQTLIYDLLLTQFHQIGLPNTANGLTCLLYAFGGNANVNNQLSLAKGESVIIKDETTVNITSPDRAELVLFITDETSAYFAGGMYSGNQTR
jgi:quercetin 2,3-dioxygenase